MIAATAAAGLSLRERGKPSSSSAYTCKKLKAKNTSFHADSNRYRNPLHHHKATQSTYPTRPARHEHHRLIKHTLFQIWDWSWRQYYTLIATFGMSVMEPWEVLFTLVLFSTLVLLFGLVVIRLPNYRTYMVESLCYYLLGHSTREIRMKMLDANGVNATATRVAQHVGAPKGSKVELRMV